MSGLYVHIPFCVSKCAYCDFYSVAGRLKLIDRYLSALLTEADTYRGMKIDTIYLGGGTPSLLGADGVRNLLSGLKKVLDLSELTEATIEVNPESVNAELLQTSRELSINRISIGVQSLNDVELGSVGRVHNAKTALLAMELIAQAGFTNVSCDLIIGLPGQDWNSLRHSLSTLLDSGINHLSLYCLALEHDTPLAQNSPPNLPSDDEQAEMYQLTCSLLKKQGWQHYEISNFAMPGFQCRHNLNYWHGGEYIGLGPAASSHLGGYRYRNKPDLDAYLVHPNAMRTDVERLKPAAKATEEAMLRLRLLEDGLDFNELSQRYRKNELIDLQNRLQSLVEEKLLLQSNSRYRLAESSALVSNPILARVIAD